MQRQHPVLASDGLPATLDPDDFACVASHDLKQPLQGLRAYCEIFQEDYGPELDGEGRRRLDAMMSLCDRLDGMVNTMLTYYRAGQSSAGQDKIDLNSVVRRTLESLHSVIDKRGASVWVVGCLPEVKGNSTLIGMLLGNLISNGLKFNQSERPLVEIGCTTDDPPALYVRDNGIGIDAEHHSEIFTIFRRLNDGSRYEGTGAGLTIVRKIVESHGGRIWLESAPGAGSTFYFTLSACIESGTEKKPPSPPHWVDRAKTGAPAEHLVR